MFQTTSSCCKWEEDITTQTTAGPVVSSIVPIEDTSASVSLTLSTSTLIAQPSLTPTVKPATTQRTARPVVSSVVLIESTCTNGYTNANEGLVDKNCVGGRVNA